MKQHNAALARVEPDIVGSCDVGRIGRCPGGTGRAANTPAYSAPRLATSAARAVPSPGVAALEGLPVPSEVRLKALFDLTAAEVRLAQHLARGDSVEEVAQALNIKMSTARTQLAAVFAKTDTRRQAKLVAILSRVAHLG